MTQLERMAVSQALLKVREARKHLSEAQRKPLAQEAFDIKSAVEELHWAECWLNALHEGE